MVAISVVVPTRNRKELLAKAVCSVARQTMTDVEIIVVDDASTDGTPSTFSKLERLCSPLKGGFIGLRRESTGGACAARNMGIDVAQGKLIAFLDSDDLWHPTKLARQLAAIGNERRALCYTGRFRTDARYRPIAIQLPSPKTDPGTAIIKSNFIGTLSSVLVHADVIRAVNGFDMSLRAGQDWDFYIRVLANSRLAQVRAPLTLYNDGGRARITSDPRARLISHLAIYRHHQRGVLSQQELGSVYRNIAESLQECRRARMANSFFARHLANEGHSLRANIVRALPFGLPIKRWRYSHYVWRNWVRRLSSEQRHSDRRYFEGFRPVLDFELSQHT